MESTALDRWCDDMRASGHGSSLVTYRSYLVRFAAWLDRCLLTAEPRDVSRWLGSHEWSMSTRKSARSALVSFYRWAVQAGELRRKQDPMRKVSTVKNVRAVPNPAPESAVVKGLHSPDPDVRLMIGLMSECGLRRGEVAGLHADDLIPDGVLIRGKGGKVRPVWLPPHLRAEVIARGDGWVFPGRFGGHIHPDSVYRKTQAATGVRPHRFRHRCASVGYSKTGDLLALRDLMGHSSVATTEGYVALDTTRVRKVVESTMIPDEEPPDMPPLIAA